MNTDKKYTRKRHRRVCVDCGTQMEAYRFERPIEETRCLSCSNKGVRNYNWKGGITGKKKVRACVGCGIQITRIRFYKPIEETRCRNCGVAKGKRHARWNGGKKMKHGYVFLLRKNHPKANEQGYVKRANFVWEQATGHYPAKGEVLHHIDGNKLNDDIDNLQLMTNSEHSTLHISRKDMSGVNNPAYKHGRYVGRRAKRKKR